MSELLKINFRRRLDGLEVNIISEKIEDLMKEWSKGKIFSPGDTGDYPDFCDYVKDCKAYSLPATVVPMLPSGKIAWGMFQNGLMYNDQFNLKYLSLVGIGKGITFTVKQPYSSKMLAQLTKSTKEVITELLQEFAKPLEASVIISEKNNP